MNINYDVDHHSTKLTLLLKIGNTLHVSLMNIKGIYIDMENESEQHHIRIVGTPNLHSNNKVYKWGILYSLAFDKEQWLELVRLFGDFYQPYVTRGPGVYGNEPKTLQYMDKNEPLSYWAPEATLVYHTKYELRVCNVNQVLFYDSIGDGQWCNPDHCGHVDISIDTKSELPLIELCAKEDTK